MAPGLLGEGRDAGDYLLDMPSLADAANSGQQAAEKFLATLAQRQTLA